MHRSCLNVSPLSRRTSRWLASTGPYVCMCIYMCVCGAYLCVSLSLSLCHAHTHARSLTHNSLPLPPQVRKMAADAPLRPRHPWQTSPSSVSMSCRCVCAWMCLYLTLTLTEPMYLTPFPSLHELQTILQERRQQLNVNRTSHGSFTPLGSVSSRCVRACVCVCVYVCAHVFYTAYLPSSPPPLQPTNPTFPLYMCIHFTTNYQGVAGRQR